MSDGQLASDLGQCDYCDKLAIVKVNDHRACGKTEHINQAMEAAIRVVHQLADDIRRERNGSA